MSCVHRRRRRGSGRAKVMHAWSQLIAAAQSCAPGCSSGAPSKKQRRRRPSKKAPEPPKGPSPKKLPSNLDFDKDGEESLEAHLVSRMRPLLGPERRLPTPCVGSCHFVCPRIEVHEKNGVFAARWPFEQVFPPWVSAKTLKHRVYSIYVCRLHNTIHVCTEATCNQEKILNEDHQLVCPISKLQLSDNDRENIHSWRAMMKCTHTVHGDKSDPNRYSRGADDRVVVRDGSNNIRDEKLLHDAVAVIHSLLLSDTRVRFEIRRRRDANTAAMKRVFKYRRGRKKVGGVICFMDEVHIARDGADDSGRYLAHLPQLRRDRRDVFSGYARDIIHIWKTFDVEIRGGAVSFDQFCISCLYMMRRGLRRGATYIIPRHPELMQLLPQVNNLVAFGIRSITPAKKCLLKIISAQMKKAAPPRVAGAN